MGFFDTIRCESPLPDECKPDGIEFQTKSLRRGLCNYAITAQGRLVLEKAWGNSTAENPIDTEYHGDVLFCGATGTGENYVARFTNGQLEWIKLAKDRKPPVIPDYDD